MKETFKNNLEQQSVKTRKAHKYLRVAGHFLVHNLQEILLPLNIRRQYTCSPGKRITVT